MAELDKTDEYAIRQEDRKIDRHSFLNYISSENLDTEKKCLYTNTKQKRNPILCQLYIGLDAYGRKKALKERVQKPKKEAKICTKLV